MSGAKATREPLHGAPVLIMAGGTGGHVYPGLSVAHELAGRGYAVEWLGTERGLEARLVPAAGFPIAFVNIAGVRGKGPAGWLLAPQRLARAVAQSLRLLRRLRPRVALGMGGFVSGPGGLAAKLAGIPLVLHEQNAVAGLTNRLLAHLANRMLEAFPGSYPSGSAAELTGNPVRPEIAALAPPQERFRGRSGPLRLLVLGGSQGARVFNQIVPQALAALAAGQRPDLWHVAGPVEVEATRKVYAQVGIPARVDGFVEDIAQAYAWADLALCRAGALTISELAAAGLGALLVPYPYAVDDHQRGNAEFLVRVGAARLLPQTSLTPNTLAAALKEVGQRARCVEMALAARTQARPDAAAEVARHCLEVSHG